MSRPRQIVLFGGQGSGKGTQAERLAERFDAELIGAGNLLRHEVATGGELAGRIAPILQAGELVPDEIASDMIAAILKRLPADRGFVIEGYPRTVNQAGHLHDNLTAIGRVAGTMFVSLDVPREILEQRLAGRRRHDDTDRVIERRLQIYEERTKPVLEAVTDWATVVHVDGDQAITDVTEAIITEMEHAEKA